MDELLVRHREEILRIAKRHGVTRIRVFGSLARGEGGEGSDADFLIDVEGPTTPWFPGGLVVDLETLLGRRVDVVESCAICEPLRKRILNEAVSL